MKMKIMSALCALMAWATVSAQQPATFDFTADSDDTTLCFKITGDKTAEVAPAEYSGDIVIPGHVTFEGVDYTVSAIGKGAFADSGDYLYSVKIPATVTVIADEAFKGCTGLTTLKLPDSVTTIGNFAFEDCGNVLQVVIPESVAEIGEGAFSGCSRLMGIFMLGGAPASIKMGADVFEGVNTLGCVLYVPRGSKPKFAAAPQWKSFSNMAD